MLFTPGSFVMSTLFTLSLCVTTFILLNILISVFSRICFSFFLTVQHSASYRNTGLTTVVQSLIFHLLGIFVSLITADRSLHLLHAALTLAFTASSGPSFSLIVLSKYLNLFTCLRLVPWLSLMFAFVTLLLLTITSVFPMLTFSPLLSIPIGQPSHLLCISSSVSVTNARSSANNSSPGSPQLNSSLMTSNTTINRNRLSPNPRCRPTLMGNSSVLPRVVLTTVDAPWYVASTSLTSLSGTPFSFSDTNTPDPWAPSHTLFRNLRR